MTDKEMAELKRSLSEFRLSVIQALTALELRLVTVETALEGTDVVPTETFDHFQEKARERGGKIQTIWEHKLPQI